MVLVICLNLIKFNDQSRQIRHLDVLPDDELIALFRRKYCRIRSKIKHFVSRNLGWNPSERVVPDEVIGQAFITHQRSVNEHSRDQAFRHKVILTKPKLERGGWVARLIDKLLSDPEECVAI